MMKFVFILVALVCTNLYFCRAGNASDNQKVCTSPGSPININVHGNGGIKGEKGEKGEKGDTVADGHKGTHCKCALQDLNKPSAHIAAINKGGAIYKANAVIKDWSVGAWNSHLTGGMKHQDGKLTVPIPGRYYIYAQLYYYYNSGRVYVRVNNKNIAIIQPPSKGKGEGTLYVGGVFTLKVGDVITLVSGGYPGSSARLYMQSYHSYFGAFFI